ncbi:MAG TPA: hypothetical protein VFZ78_00020 [Flavisolibacter sp.]
MKHLLVVLCIVASVGAFAQADKNFSITEQQRKRYFPENNISEKDSIPRVIRDHDPSPFHLLLPANPVAMSKLGAVYELRQDHMPCIVPDMRNFTTMPNAGSSPFMTDPGIWVPYYNRHPPYGH